MTKKFTDPFAEAAADDASPARRRSPQKFAKDLTELIADHVPLAIKDSDMAATLITELTGHLGATIAVIYPDPATRRDVIEASQRKVASVAADFSGETVTKGNQVKH
jgi:hypothetical protein